MNSPHEQSILKFRIPASKFGMVPPKTRSKNAFNVYELKDLDKCVKFSFWLIVCLFLFDL